MAEAEGEQRLAERVVGGMLERDAFSQWLGISVLAIRPRGATVSMRVRAEMVNGFGLAHGGVVYSLADSALAFASNSHGRVTVSVENSITYPLPVHVDDELTAVAEEESASQRLGYYRVTVRRRDGAIIALFRGTVYKTKNDFFARRPDEAAQGEGESNR